MPGRRRTNIVAILAFGAGAIALAAPLARAALSGASEARVAFHADGTAGIKIDGATSELGIAEQGDDVVVTVPLGNLATGIGLRDKHMKERYLEVPKYPVATLSVARRALKLPSGAEKVEADVPSTLTLHGRSKPVIVHYSAKRDGGSLETHGRFRINMNDFGISVPSYLGITVKPDVGVSADFRVAGD